MCILPEHSYEGCKHLVIGPLRACGDQQTHGSAPERCNTFKVQSVTNRRGCPVCDKHEGKREKVRKFFKGLVNKGEGDEKIHDDDGYVLKATPYHPQQNCITN